MSQILLIGIISNLVSLKYPDYERTSHAHNYLLNPHSVCVRQA
jgi:hypothetical protein